MKNVKDTSSWSSALVLIGMIGVVIFYLLSHLFHLTSMPIFADESIYIRWAQLIMDEPLRYLFFALNDGKTPLFIWLLVPFQFLAANQLFAARLVAVLVGLLQLFVTKELVRALGGRPKTQLLAMLLTAILPFWYFHHRMALMDGMFTVLISLTVLGTIHLTELQQNLKRPVPWIIFTGLALGLTFWTKMPALFLLPTLPLWIFRHPKLDRSEVSRQLMSIGLAALLGVVIFGSLRVSPAFGQLFRRSSDFGYSLTEVLLQGKWQETLPNFPNYAFYFIAYLTWPVVVMSLAGLFSNRVRRITGILLLSALVFIGPFMVFGKVVYPRYLLPAAVFITVASVLALQAWYHRCFSARSTQSLAQQVLIAAVITFLANATIITSLQFMRANLFQPNSTPFVTSDRGQYLTDWSSGHGIVETVEYIRQQATQHSIAVATEGRFGTLPDALLVYLHNTDLKNIYVEGTGQYPVKTLPDFFIKRAKDFDQSILVVNSNRREIRLADDQLIAEFCRPYNAPCLQIWDVTDQVK